MAVRRFDFLQEVHFDPERQDGALATVDEKTGFLRVDARLARIGVQIYRDAEGNEWGELRTEDEVFADESLRSFQMVVVTDDHPSEFVNSRNVRDVQKGHVGTDVRRDGDYMRASLLITDAVLIQKIRDGKVQISNGYTAEVVPDKGRTDSGEVYSFRQTTIRGNHAAIVDFGRAGPECRVLDSGDAVSAPKQEQPMKTRKIKIGDVEHELPIEVADAIEAERKAAAEALAKTDTGAPPPGADDDEEEDEGKTDSALISKLTRTVEKLTAKVDMLETADTGSAVDSRVRLLSACAAVGVTDTSGKKDIDLMKAVVLAVNPKMEPVMQSKGDSLGYVEACFDAAMQLHSDRRGASADLNGTIFSAVSSGATALKKDEDSQKIDAEFGDFQKGFRLHNRQKGEEG